MKTFITAHSGSDGTPDNSMEFVRYAMNLDVDFVEVDVRAWADGTLVLTHDEGPGVPMKDALQELARHPGIKLNCDLKTQGLEILTWDLAEACGVEAQIVFSGSVSQNVWQTESRLREKVDWFLNIELLFPDVYEPEFIQRHDAGAAAPMAEDIRRFLETHNARCLNVHYLVTETPLYDELMRRNIPLSAWTPNDEHILRRLMADGVYNITTRNAKRACEIAREFSALRNMG